MDFRDDDCDRGIAGFPEGMPGMKFRGASFPKNNAMKRIEPFIPLAVCLVLFSCASADRIYSSQGGDGGQIFFLRPFEVDVPPGRVSAVTMDITTHVRKGEITRNPVLNYSVYMAKGGDADAADVSITLSSPGARCAVLSREAMYRDVQGKFLEARYTSELDKESFSALLRGGGDILIHIAFPDGKTEAVLSKELNLRMSDLRLVAWQN